MISQIFVVVCLASVISAQVITSTSSQQPSTTFQSTPYTSTGMPSSTWSSATWQPSSTTTEQPKQSDACCAITACNYEKIEIVQKLLAMASSLENSIKAPAECRQQQSTTTAYPSSTTEYPTTATSAYAPAGVPIPALEPISIGNSIGSAVPA